jgi:hypothetical protein
MVTVKFRMHWKSILLIGLPFGAFALLRWWLMPMSRMPFDSDEAIFVLMARHILQGARPVFFYGEAYGGSTDSYLTALFFALLDDSVTVARLTQSLEYAIGMLFTFLLARRLLPEAKFGPMAMLWLMAVPPLLVTTWTTPAVLYAVVLGLGAVISYLGYRLLFEDAERLPRWLLFGAVCGIAFWTFGLLVVYMMPVFLLFLWQFRWRRLHLYGLSALMFFLFSLPWWQQALPGLMVVYDPQRPPEFFPPLLNRILAFLAITLPGFFGFRQPWGPQISWPAAAIPLLMFYLAALLYAIPRLRRRDPAQPVAEPVGFALLGLQVLTWLALFFGTRFGVDATGRYILPLYPVLFIAAGLLLERIYRWRRGVALALLLSILVFNLAMHWQAIQRVPPGITAQMNPDFWFGNQDDQALTDFVAAQGGRGYSHHWISYKIAFLSREQVILAAFLPWSPSLRWNELDDRYAPYGAAAEAAPHPVYVTHREPKLEAYLQQALAGRGIGYQLKDIGPYRVYYNLSAQITPMEMGLGPGQP